MNLVSGIVFHLAMEGVEGCTLRELWDLAEEYVLPRDAKGSSPSSSKRRACAELLKRPDVVFADESGAKRLGDLLDESSDGSDFDPFESEETGGLVVSCTESRREIAMLGGRVTFLNMLGEGDKSCLTVVAKKRYEGLVQKNFERDIGVSQSMAYATIEKLVELGLVVKQRVVVKKEREDKENGGQEGKDQLRVVNNLTNCVYLPCFVPNIKDNVSHSVNDDENAKNSSKESVSLVYTDTDGGRDAEKKILAMLSTAQGGVLRCHEMRSSLGLDKRKFQVLTTKLVKESLVEECFWTREGKSGGSTRLRCLKLLKRSASGDHASTSGGVGAEEGGTRDFSGSHVFAESFPIKNIVHLLESTAPDGVQGNEIETRCWLNGRKKHKIFQSLEVAKVIKKERYTLGKEIGWKYKLIPKEEGGAASVGGGDGKTKHSGKGGTKEAPIDLDEIDHKSDVGETFQNRSRQSFIMSLLKKRPFVLVSYLQQDYESLHMAKGEKTPHGNIFKDRKCVLRSIDALVEKKLCELHTMSSAYKHSAKTHEYRVLLASGTELDESLKSKIEKAVQEKRMKKGKPSSVKLEEVKQVPSISNGVQRRTKKEKEKPKAKEKPKEKPKAKPKAKPKPQPPKPTRSNHSQDVAKKDMSTIPPSVLTNPRLKLNGLVFGLVARAKALHEHLWKDKTRVAKAPLVVKMRQCVLTMTIESFLTLIGVETIPGELGKDVYSAKTKIGGLPEPVQAQIFDSAAESRLLHSIWILQGLGLLKELPVADSQDTLPYVQLSPCAPIVYGHHPAAPGRQASPVGANWSVVTKEDRKDYWRVLQNTFKSLTAAQCKSGKRFPGSAVGAICDQTAWEVGLATNADVSYKVRQAILTDFGKNASFADPKKLQALSKEFKVDANFVGDVAKLWVQLTSPAAPPAETTAMETDPPVDAPTGSAKAAAAEVPEASVKRKRPAGDSDGSLPVPQQAKQARVEPKEIPGEARGQEEEEAQENDDSESDDVQPAPRPYTYEEDKALVTAFSIAMLTQSSRARVIKWDKIPIIPQYLIDQGLPTLRLKRLREEEGIDAGMREMTKFCALSSKKSAQPKEGEEEQMAKYPDSLMALVRDDERLKDCLVSRGSDFAIEWAQRLDALHVTFKEEREKAIQKAKRIQAENQAKNQSAGGPSSSMKRRGTSLRRIQATKTLPYPGYGAQMDLSAMAARKRASQRRGGALAGSRYAIPAPFIETNASFGLLKSITDNHVSLLGRKTKTSSEAWLDRVVNKKSLQDSGAPELSPDEKEGLVLNFVFRNPGAKADLVASKLAPRMHQEDVDTAIESCVTSGRLSEVQSAKKTKHYFLTAPP